MNLEELREYCLAKTLVEECTPFGPDTLVYKVAGKIFLITGFDEPLSINVKCNPEKAVELREKYSAVQPGYHMNKKHWNTVLIDGSVSDKELKSFIDESYLLAAPKRNRKNS